MHGWAGGVAELCLQAPQGTGAAAGAVGAGQGRGGGRGGALKVHYVLSYRHVLVGGPPGGRSGVGMSVCGGTSASAGCR